jgi:NADPH:quinone reductase-like Zn-dependent oxidoreductase
VIATSSPKNFDFVKSYGAEAVFDYNSPTCAEEIRSYTKNILCYALDIVGTASSMSKCYSAIGRAGGNYTSLERFDQEMATKLRRAVKADFALGLSMTGEKMEMGGGYGAEAMPHRRELAARWFASLQKQVDAGRIRSHPPRELDGGLQGVMGGLDELRRGAVSGQKLVCRVN